MKYISHSPPGPLLVMIVAFGCLAGYYSFVTPIFETPDEVWHYAYIRQLALKHALPVVDAEGKEPYRHEGLQPPLYYAVGSTLIGWMSERDLAMPVPNPYARIGDPRAASNDNRNAFLHSPGEQFPFEGNARAVHLLRLYSVFWGTLTVLLTFLLAYEIFPEHSTLALGAASLVAFLPQFLFISGAISNDNLATALSAASLWIMTRMVRRGLTTRQTLALSALIGAALLTKLNTIALLPLAGLVLLYAGWQQHDWRVVLKQGMLLAGIVTLIAGWWYLRNLQLYGDLTTFSRLAMLVGERARPLGLWRWATAEGEGLRLSSWGMFGWFNILAPPEFYRFYDFLAALGLLGLGVALVTRRHLSPALAILPLWCGLVFLALWGYASNIITSQGRLLFPALAAWAVLWSWGIFTLLPERIRAAAFGAGAIGLALIAAWVPGSIIAPAYAATFIAGNVLPPNTQVLGWRFENGSEWLGASVDRRAIRPGEELNLTLYQRLPAGPVVRDALFIHVLNSAGLIIAQRDSLPASGNLAALPAPSVIADRYTISIPIGVPAPDNWRVEMGMYDPAGGRRIPAHAGNASAAADAMLLSSIEAVPAPAESWNFEFDGAATLIGAAIDQATVRRDQPLSLSLQWRNVPSSSTSWRVFVHALGENEQMWAGADKELADTTTGFHLNFNPQTPPGVYQLEVGVYPAPNGDRTAVFDRRGQDIGDRLFLGPIRVTEP